MIRNPGYAGGEARLELKRALFGELELAAAGLDVYGSILEVLAEEYGERFATPAELRELIEQGRVGAKAGAGFREYEPAEVEALLGQRDATYRRLLRAAPADG